MRRVSRSEAAEQTRRAGGPRSAGRRPVRRSLEHHGRRRTRRRSADDAVYLPGRNALLLVKAAVWCRLHGVGELALAVLRSNPFADATPEFFAEFESAIARAAGGRVRFVRPFGAMSKREVMALGRGLPLELTFSCIAPRDGRHCGACNKCAERQAAFEAIGDADPTEYAAIDAGDRRQETEEEKMRVMGMMGIMGICTFPSFSWFP